MLIIKFRKKLYGVYGIDNLVLVTSMEGAAAVCSKVDISLLVVCLGSHCV